MVAGLQYSDDGPPLFTFIPADAYLEPLEVCSRFSLLAHFLGFSAESCVRSFCARYLRLTLFGLILAMVFPRVFS
jgi:hypothetical protein